MAAVTSSIIEWAVSSLTLAGQTECGDRCIVVESGSSMLLAALDGIGHGSEAAVATARAVAAIQGKDGRHLPSLFQHCHMSLANTRGVVMSMALITQQGTMTWMGIGDVEGRVVRENSAGFRVASSLMLGAGVVGERLPTLLPSSVSLVRNDLVIFATDGVRKEFTDGLRMKKPVQEIADDIIARHGRYTDDALVLVARYLG